MNAKPTNPSENPISLKQLADELGFHPSSIRKAVVRRGFVTRTVSAGKNKPLYLSYEDALAFRKRIHDERNGRAPMASTVTPNRQGGVYFIEVPSYDGVNRIKIGWSESFADRVSSYRTLVPDLRVKAFWPTSDSWCERAALKCAERLGKRVHQELFEFEDNEKALVEINDLFLKMGIRNLGSDRKKAQLEGAGDDSQGA